MKKDLKPAIALVSGTLSRYNRQPYNYSKARLEHVYEKGMEAMRQADDRGSVLHSAYTGPLNKKSTRRHILVSLLHTLSLEICDHN